MLIRPNSCLNTISKSLRLLIPAIRTILKLLEDAGELTSVFKRMPRQDPN